MAANTEKPTPQPGSKLGIILPIVIVGLCIILLCVIVVVLLRRRQKMRDAVDNGHALSHKGSITMRDRLRAESLKSLDSRLLGLYDPKKLRQYNLDHVQYVKDLGEGFFGKVFQGTLYLIKNSTSLFHPLALCNSLRMSSTYPLFKNWNQFISYFYPIECVTRVRSWRWEWGVYPQSPQVFSSKFFKSIVP